MELTERQKRYKAIEDYRARSLIVYATSTRQGVPAIMAGDVVREFVDQIDAIPDGQQVDVLMHSTGGDALASWKLMSILRERFQGVSVLVPFMAFSAATLFALGAEQIVMHPHASLGPIDPQVTIPQPDGTRRQFSYEDVGALLRFLATEVKISEQVYVSAVIEKLFSVVDPLTMGSAKRASELSSSVGERLLLMHMGEDRDGARQIAENLNKTFFAHSDAVSRSRGKELHLKIADDDKQLEKLMWEAYLGLESYMELRKPFHPIQHFLANPQAAATLQPPAPLAIPPNAPPQIVAGLWQAATQQTLMNQGRRPVEVEYSIVMAVLESTRACSEYRTKGKLSAFRAPNGEIQLCMTDTEAAWKRVDAAGLAAATA
jgi:hypothetical protein